MCATEDLSSQGKKGDTSNVISSIIALELLNFSKSFNLTIAGISPMDINDVVRLRRRIGYD